MTMKHVPAPGDIVEAFELGDVPQARWLAAGLVHRTLDIAGDNREDFVAGLETAIKDLKIAAKAIDGG